MLAVKETSVQWLLHEPNVSLAIEICIHSFTDVSFIGVVNTSSIDTIDSTLNVIFCPLSFEYKSFTCDAAPTYNILKCLCSDD